MDERFIGGFAAPPSPLPPAVPPKDNDYFGTQTQTSSQPSYLDPSHLTHLSAVERSRSLKGARMEPHLQFMVGPLLRYDTVDAQGVWHGAALIVTADAGSEYEPHPNLSYEWDPDAPPVFHRGHRRNVMSFDLPPHPADPHSVFVGADGEIDGALRNSVDLWDTDRTFTFWRFLIQIPLGPHEMRIKYYINNGQEMDFWVPGIGQNMRWATYSCNGFSAGVNPDNFRGPGFQSGYDPVWVDLLSKHQEEPFHALVGGGDQLYCDGLTREPELQGWVTLTKPEAKKQYPLSEEIVLAIDRFYFNHYCQSFRSGAFARANSSIPMMNMCDDHGAYPHYRLIDGFGSYPDDLQLSPVFRRIGSRGYFFFLLFQCFINPEVDGLDDGLGKHVNKSLIIGGPGPYVPYPSHSFLSYMGPNVWMLLLDCRAERRKDQVCSPLEYQKVMQRLWQIPAHVEHVVVQIGIPIAYPRMVFMETMLESKFNPLVALGRNGSMGLTGFVNKFNAEAELLDDLNDHWTATSHKKERNMFIQQLQDFALQRHVRVSFLSGDVHCAAVGMFMTFAGKKGKAVPPPVDHRYMINVVTSAIVNTPPPAGVITMVATLATKVHRTMHYCHTDETMMPIFQKDTNGTPLKNKYIMGRRNWCGVRWDQASGDLVFDICVEKEKGIGTTVPYQVRAPPPRWNS
ncbi:hypothetical protein GLOTRDRAFT_36442 [Gloeophyllum trabeum ATCC 11539]|uniref:PhoD-like phosphatase domain-containing protein n=1 Tax=Gloeophyllum trabeum (strain ATCC 11539 / FP-39264 / Madison 617) TaxID=670483 RepID=S7RYD9_GLOTA|nr:uncharacterized protein GLOTRDRAFT_36442 [Gloeophyllum trabeum ATCC 11539]EPQ58419.1 hypothetical protein GLOTRDRAFT_36442 [Gloeophyllum trabeum ATCC 11539]